MKPWEAALLAGIPADPTLYDPVAHPRLSRERRNLVLLKMREQRYLTRAQYLLYIQEPMPDPTKVALPSTQGQAPYFANYVKDQLVHRFGPRGVLGGGLRVKTTIDLGLQKLARDAVAQVLTDPNGPTAALVSIDARTGAILAMVGGGNYHHSQFNLATQGERQPGSSFKPFVLATALREGIAPETTFESRPVTINASGRLWEVNNYEGEYLGPIDLAQATAYSDNSVYAQLTKTVGPRNVAKTAKDLGIQTPLKGYFAIGLGAEPATPLEMARAFSAFANGGFRVDGSLMGNVPRAVDCLTDTHGTCVKDNIPAQSAELTSAQAALETQLLQGVVRYGTGKAAQLPGREVAGKTGTTENYGDAWFVGFTPQVVTSVWVGYPDSLRPMLTEYHGKPVAGGTFPALIWKAFMEKALPYLEKAFPYLKAQSTSFPAPPSLYASPVTVTFRHGEIERDNGVCNQTTQLVFFSGEEPKHVADCKPNEVEVPNVVGNTVADAKARLAGQPLSATIVYKPALAGQKVGVVIGQIPAGGRLSAHDAVTLVLGKPQHGVVPRVVGLTVDKARDKLDPLRVDITVAGDGTGRIVKQTPRWGVAAAPGMRVTLSVRKTAG
jgi:penicillin-binding protein 1A